MSRGYLAKCSSRNKPKKSYPTQTEAEAQRWSLINAGIWRADKTNTYFCSQCGGWHAGTMGRSNRGKGRKVTAKNTPRFLATQ
jgi:hypothetical protein